MKAAGCIRLSYTLFVVSDTANVCYTLKTPMMNEVLTDQQLRDYMDNQFQENVDNFNTQHGVDDFRPMTDKEVTAFINQAHPLNPPGVEDAKFSVRH